MLPLHCCLLAFSCLNLPLTAQSSPVLAHLLSVRIAGIKILTPSCCPQESCSTQTDSEELTSSEGKREVIGAGETGTGWTQVLPGCISADGHIASTW